MCQFFSAIVTKAGDILAVPEYTDSHEDLILHFGLEDTKDPLLNAWIRVEFVPNEPRDIAEPESYRLRVDEPCRPVWFDADLKERVVSEMRARIRRMIIRDSRKLVLGGCWIIDGGTIERMARARVVEMLSGKIDALCSSQVGTMWGSSRVGTMRDSSRIDEMRDSAQIGTMWDSSQIGTMWDSSQIGKMRGSSRIGTMWHSSQIGKMRGSSRIGTMWHSSRIGTMRESSQVGKMWDSSRVGKDMRKRHEEVM